jgi:hypothetical protein
MPCCNRGVETDLGFKLRFSIMGRYMNEIFGDAAVNLMIKLSLSALALLSTAQISAQTPAPSAPEEKINQLIVYGQDECPQSKGDEIIVCARLAEKERYRIPTSLRDDPSDIRKEAFTNKVIAYEHVSASGTMSCSPSGAGGFTGCPGINFGRLIAAERKKRLAGIDAEAAQVEERVKLFEKERAEKEARQAGSETEPSDPVVDNQALPEPK